MNAPAESINRRMAKGAGWSVISRLIVRSLGFISTLILARLLIPEDFGLVVVATTCVGIIEVMGEFGLDTVLITRQDASKSLYDTAWTLQVLPGFLLFLLVFIGSEYMASFFVTFIIAYYWRNYWALVRVY